MIGVGQKERLNTKRLYKNGLPFSDILRVNLDDYMSRVKRNLPVIIVIDGGPGNGKTTLAWEIVEYVFKKGKEINQDKITEPRKKDHLGMGGEDFLTKFNNFAKESPAIIYDEARDLSRRRSLTSMSHDLLRVFDTARVYKCIIIVIVRYVYMLDKSLFEGEDPVIRVLLNVYDRSMTEGNIRAYDPDSISWLLYHAEKIKGPKRYCYYKQTPNFRAHFKDLPYIESKELEKMSLAGKDRINKEAEIRSRGLITIRDIAREVQLTPAYVSKVVRDLNIVEAEILGRTKYFKPEVMIKIKKRGLKIR